MKNYFNYLQNVLGIRSVILGNDENQASSSFALPASPAKNSTTATDTAKPKKHAKKHKTAKPAKKSTAAAKPDASKK